jgi:hypothetical protein
MCGYGGGAALCNPRAYVEQQNGAASLRRKLCNALAHGASAHDTDTLNLLFHCLIIPFA